MSSDDLGALHRPQVIVRIRSGLVFDKVIRRGHLANVVVERADAGEQRIGADRARRIFRQLADGVGMLVRARRPHGKFAQDWNVGVRELEKSDVRENAE